MGEVADKAGKAWLCEELFGRRFVTKQRDTYLLWPSTVQPFRSKGSTVTLLVSFVVKDSITQSKTSNLNGSLIQNYHLLGPRRRSTKVWEAIYLYNLENLNFVKKTAHDMNWDDCG